MQIVGQEVDDRLFRNAMGSFTTGVTVITTEIAEEVHGMTANAFMSISLNPRLVAISVGENARMFQYIKDAKKFAVNILSSDQQKESMQFAGQLKEEHEIAFSTYKGLPIIEDALAVVTCELHSEYVAGDHTIFIGHVTGVKLSQKDPLLFSQGKYRELKELQE
ncbi:flavin reductase family protein [Sporosarcina limicola]|uniref:Flavin reductase (DIM6/NTAB) family NADH-FMN oxidoreductase RutF n=1 Tax=Sporosarcina limicola TaxID=34101 RepID=A0A927R3J8_9BACL|nr:flavin reductase family protein [Sporosarcina limicola]MBE1555181.1 flavin reductase (DIM6/NTAB) family NADH-FMN oxidoreductase RutF [Sporosarcina limicola]